MHLTGKCIDWAVSFIYSLINEGYYEAFLIGGINYENKKRMCNSFPYPDGDLFIFKSLACKDRR